MTRLKRTLMACVCLAALSAPAVAADFPEPAPTSDPGSWYIRGDGGIGITSAGFFDGDTGIAVGGGIGYQYSDMFRTDITFDAAFDYKDSGVSVDAYDVIGNVYLDAPLSTWFKPYIGAGAGFGWVDSNVGISDEGAAVAGMAGIGFDVVENITLDVGYKYRRIFISGTDFDDHLIRGGFRFSF